MSPHSSSSSVASEVAPEQRALEELLARVGPEERHIYNLVRDLIDEMEQAAPWDLLYFRPDTPDGLLEILFALRECVQGIPERISELLQRLEALPETDRDQIEEVGFFFSGVHEMVSHDLGRLERRLEPFLGTGGMPEISEQLELCEISADLKGKYVSAMMGVAASIVSHKLEAGLELEPVLFPEKAEEFARNEQLLEELGALVATFSRLPEEVPFEEALERWRHHLRVDPYALAELSILKGQLRRLLQRRNRRALYSGDYQRVKSREAELSCRLQEIEDLHGQSWQESGAEIDAEAVFGRLSQLLMEVAAIIDANILKGLLGEGAVGGLRKSKASQRTEIARSHFQDSEHREAVAVLLAEEDLRTFLDFLLGVVRKRASFSRADAEELIPPEPVLYQEPTLDDELMEVVLPEPDSPRPEPGDGSTRKLEELGLLLQEICSPANSRWNSFRMVHRLVEKHARVPPSMVLGASPLLDELKARLSPLLESLATNPDLTQPVVSQLRTSLLAIRSSKLQPGQSQEESAATLIRIVETVDQLQETVGTIS